MQPTTELGKLKQINLINRCLGISLAGLAVFVLGFILVPALASEASATTDISAAVTWKNITLTLDTGGDIDFGEVLPSSVDTTIGNFGTQKVVKKNITVTTEGNYYAIYLSTTGSNNALSASGSTVREIPAITPASGDDSSSFSSASWGYAIPYIEGKSSSTFPTAAVLSAYDDYLASSSDAALNNLSKTGIGSVVYNTGTWAPVPVLASAAQVYKNSTEAVSGFYDGDTFNIYYSLMADTNTMSGVYTNEIIYTALASSASLDEVSQNLSRDKDTVTSGMVETLQIDLATADASLTDAGINVYLVPHSTFAASDYDIENLVETDYPECSILTVSSSGVTATVTCALPAYGTTGATDLSGDNIIVVGGTYDFWAKVATPVSGTYLNYVSHYEQGDIYISAILYANIGLQTKDRYGNYVITTMQQMTSAVCQNTTYYSSDSVTYSLEDSRDGNSYDIRKFDDGNCWMAENLRNVSENLYDFVDGTDVHYTYSQSLAVCPEGWEIPTASQYSGIVNYASAFNPSAKGYSIRGEIMSPTVNEGFWYSTTPYEEDNRFQMFLDYKNAALSVVWGIGSIAGMNVRCVASD